MTHVYACVFIHASRRLQEFIGNIPRSAFKQMGARRVKDDFVSVLHIVRAEQRHGGAPAIDLPQDTTTLRAVGDNGFHSL